MLYVKDRLRNRGLRRFIEVGAGNGYLSRALLSIGLTGIGFDLNPEACENNRIENSAAIRSGHYTIRCEDFVTAVVSPTDLIISSMVIEHLKVPELRAYFTRCRDLVSTTGLIVTIVPASPRHWGIEDDIAGHQKRYTRDDINEIAREHQLRVVHVAGLTYPVSNLLLGLSNRLARRAESWKLAMGARERTLISGNRHVWGKTEFPDATRYFVNEVTLFPLHLLQYLTRGSRHALVLYAEMKPAN